MLGMDLTRVTVLAGAFGVGIGFGPQERGEQFCLRADPRFERPVHVGDIVEVGETTGGSAPHRHPRKHRADLSGGRHHRAQCAVHNRQRGPTGLSAKKLRRIDLPVGVSYSAAPQTVIELLEKDGRRPMRRF